MWILSFSPFMWQIIFIGFWANLIMVIDFVSEILDWICEHFIEKFLNKYLYSVGRSWCKVTFFSSFSLFLLIWLWYSVMLASLEFWSLLYFATLGNSWEILVIVLEFLVEFCSEPILPATNPICRTFSLELRPITNKQTFIKPRSFGTAEIREEVATRRWGSGDLWKLYPGLRINGQSIKLTKKN